MNPALFESIFLKACSILSSSSGLIGRLPQQQNFFFLPCWPDLWGLGCMLTPTLRGVSWGLFSILSLMVDQSTRFVLTAKSKKFSLDIRPFLSHKDRAVPSSNSTWSKRQNKQKFICKLLFLIFMERYQQLFVGILIFAYKTNSLVWTERWKGFVICRAWGCIIELCRRNYFHTS